MPFAAAALPILKVAAPALISGGLGLFGNRKTGAEKQMEANTAQQSAMANMIAQIANQQHTMAQPALNKAMQYYTNLASGSRSALNSAIAPEQNALMDTYKGAEAGMTSRMAGGPTRERAVAELYRQKAGQMGMMPMLAKQGAISGLGDLGQNIMGMGNQMYGQAGNLLQGASYGLGQQANMQQGRQQGWASFGESLGNIFGPYLMGKLGGKGGTKNPYGGNLPTGITLPPFMR